jgi:pheromone shutdown protein TraB
VLGDRPIEITLERAWNALPWQRRFKLLGDLMLASLAPQAEVGGVLAYGRQSTCVNTYCRPGAGPYGCL